jgi:hypothetical protein
VPEPTLDSLLAGWSEDDVTVKLVWAIMDVIPGAPALSIYRSLDEARLLAAPDLDEAGFARARAFADGPAVRQVLKVSDWIDTGDVGLSAFTGIRAALGLFFNQGAARAFDTDPQQGADAVLKAAAIGYVAHTLYTGSVTERFARFRATPAGEVLLTWYAAAEVALPFADDVATGVGSVLGSLVTKYGGAPLARLDALVGSGAGAAASGMLGTMTGPVDEVVRSVAAHSGRIAEAARQYLPGAITTAGTVAGAVATAADALPVYRLLGARLCADASLAAGRA